jgi:hypothetical protein
MYALRKIGEKEQIKVQTPDYHYYIIQRQKLIYSFYKGLGIFFIFVLENLENPIIHRRISKKF